LSFFKIEEIKELIKLVETSSIDELKIDNDGFKLTIKKEKKVKNNSYNNSVETKNLVESTTKLRKHEEIARKDKEDKNENLHKIVSPMVGTFYRAPSPNEKPYVLVGDTVTKNTVVCIIEAMKLMNEIEAEVTGEVVEVLVENGDLVEYGQPLFLIKKAK